MLKHHNISLSKVMCCHFYPKIKYAVGMKDKFFLLHSHFINSNLFNTFIVMPVSAAAYSIHFDFECDNAK